jgi:multiple sugar transport system ATP-binding protein
VAATVSLHGVTKRFDHEHVAVDDLTLEIAEGEFAILVGPSGCGKTTALRMIAGLEEATSGEIRVGGRLVNDLPPTSRDIAMVFQNYALYPHMSVYDNLRFPLRLKHVAKDEARERVLEVARLLSIDDLLERKPAHLSGGQRQRVAIGRALVRRPQAFLMDEPLSNLDAKLRVQMRTELLSLQRQLGVTTVYVTHDQTEAMTLGDRVVVMKDGVVQQIDAPAQLYSHPANMFVAGFIGSPAMNFFHGSVDGDAVDIGPSRLPLERASHGSREVIVGLRPEDFALTGDSDPDAALVIDVQLTEELGSETLAYCTAEGIRILHAHTDRDEDDQLRRSGALQQMFVVRAPTSAHLNGGDRVGLKVDCEAIRLFDPDSGRALAA